MNAGLGPLRRPIRMVLRWQLIATLALTLAGAALAGLHGADAEGVDHDGRGVRHPPGEQAHTQRVGFAAQRRHRIAGQREHAGQGQGPPAGRVETGQ